MTTHALMSDTGSLETTAPAKVNLALAITGRRADGYHELRSIFLRVELADTLALGDAIGLVDELVIEGDPDCPVTGNLVLRAVDGFRAAAAAGTAVPVPSVRLTLTKRIPMAAGLAGGSTDAATALRLLALRHRDAVVAEELAAVAARIGADVPFFLNGAGAALVSGIGEAVEPLPPPIEPVGVLLLSPPTGASTSVVFGAWDDHVGASASTKDAPRATGTTASVEAVAHLLRTGVDARTLSRQASAIRDANDLWPAAAAVTPGLGALRATIERLLDRPVMLTGSGSTLFCLYPSPEAAAAEARDLRSERSLAGLRIRATGSTGPYLPTTITRRNP